MNRKTLLPAIKSGVVSEAVIDEHVERLLSTALRFDWISHEQLDLRIPRFNPEGDTVALRNAEEGAVLLKNTGLLPLNPQRIKRIAVLGQDAFPAVPSAGGSGYVLTFHSVSLLEGIVSRFSRATVTYARGVKNINHLALETEFHPTNEGSSRGVTVETFNTEFSGKPVSTRIEPSMTLGSAFNSDPEGKPDYSTWTLEDIAPMLAPPKEGMNQRWTGYLKADTQSMYYAFVQTGSRFKLSVDDKALIDNTVIAKAALNQTSIELTPGVHKMVVDLYGGGDFGQPTLRAGLVSRKRIVDPYAVKLAQDADVVVIGAGFSSDNETEGSDRGFDLPVGQDDLISEVAAINKNTVVAITSGGSVNLPWLNQVAGVFALWYPGQEGGKALAKLLAGDLSPSGRLPISWERNLEDDPSIATYWFQDAKAQEVPYQEGVFVGYRGYDKQRRDPLFPFGFGLSYTHFAYSNLKISSDAQTGYYSLSATIKNTGKMPAADVVQLYVRDPHATAENATQELKGFQRVLLQPNQETTVTFRLVPRSFTHYDTQAHHWHALAGERVVLLGHNERDTLVETRVLIPELTVE
jgi:beta-glucosidase